MPPKSAESLLFHKKKSIKKEPSTSSTPSLSSQPSQSQSSLRKSATPRIQPTPSNADVDDSSKLPEGEFAEYKLMSSALNGWKYDVMKFDSRKTVDISTWEEPIKLNRKELRREESGPTTQVPAGHMLGPDGKPVVGSDGKIVMVDADGRPIANNGGETLTKEKEKDKDKGKAPGRKKFQKKTRQVFLVPEATRQLRREERYPWVMEDAKQNELWVGKLEEVARAETHALFMPAAQEVFKFVPAHRWYKFQRKPKHYVPGLEEAEALMAKIQKNKDPERWLLHRRKGQAASAATSEMFKAEAENRVVSSTSSLVYSSGQSRAIGGRMLRTTNRGPRGGGGEDDEGASKRKKENDMEGDLDEQLFDDEFADDDDAGPADMDEEEAKELEERLKREYKSANKTRDGYVDESESEDGESQLTKDGKSLKKLMRKLEKNAAYDSDDERNPYASSNEEEEEEEEPTVPTGAIQEQPPQNKSRSASQQPTPKTSQLSTSATQNGSAVGSRATSPAPTNLGGHSVVAKRATSPKVPKPKSTSTNGGRPTSGLGAGSRATSPVTGSRATSPATPVKGPGSPTPNGQPTSSNKRKATDDFGGGVVSPGAAVNGMTAPPKPKKRKPLPSGPSPEGELEEKMLVEWLQNTPNATTLDCIRHFTPYLTTSAKKAKFTAMVKEVAQLRGGILILRNREASAAASPAS